LNKVRGDEARDLQKVAQGVQEGDRRALARAITLVESSRPEHRLQARSLLEALLPESGKAVRVGISGVPGVGKSSFIETLGLLLIERGHRLAVLAVDPSSQRSGGSILGDKTRMEQLARRQEAFIRPSPTAGTLGGVARRTREAIVLVEAAGYDVVFVETVGVGQSETAVADMVDMFLLLLAPGTGDALQGIKKGIVELADLVVVNKSDGELEAAAGRAAAEYRHALDLLRPARPEWRPPVLRCSSLTGKGIAEVWDTVGRYLAAMKQSGAFEERRREQARAWLWSDLREGLVQAAMAEPKLAERAKSVEQAVLAGEMTPTSGARDLLDRFLGRGEASAKRR
jgi:LAO/AO transport system kinase